MNDTPINKTMILLWLMGTLLTCESARADFVFGPAQNLGPVLNSPSSDFGTCTSADGLELYFSSNRPGGSGEADIWVSTRESTEDPWGPPANLGPTVNSPYADGYPSLSSDGLTLYFSGDYSSAPRPGGLGGADIWMTTRASRNAPWDAPVNLGASVNSYERDFSPTICGDGLILVFTSTRSGGLGSWDLWMATRASVEDTWNPAVNLGANVNSGSVEGECALSADGLALLFLSNRAGGMGSWDLWMTTRKSVDDSWSFPVNVGPAVNSVTGEGSAGISADMKTLYFTSDRGGGLGGYDLWGAPIMPVADFDGNETVDIYDLVRLIESWGRDDPAVDIGPGPWGDGIVDAADLEVLMSYWGQEIPNPALIAHWRLDETEGVIAADNVGTSGGTLFGNPVWQPAGGRVGGALQLDGVDDCVTTEFICNPSKGPFSIFVWVKGGAPGQVILSQQAGANWLMADPATGALMTELQSGGRNSKALHSDAVIADGAWHRVGFTWDGQTRILYVDDSEVALDTQSSLTGCSGGLHFGCDKNVPPGTFWAGMIDDVRIYNQAVTP